MQFRVPPLIFLLGCLTVISSAWRISHAQEVESDPVTLEVPTSDSSQLAFELQQIGPPPFHRPKITNVQIVDLDRNGSQDVVVCDAQAQAVYCYRKSDAGLWEEQLLGDDLIAPAHATVVDLDQDGDSDVLVSVMGNLYPDDGVIGSLVLLENKEGVFEKRVLLDDVRRVVDAQPGDFDKDGDIDLAVAVFGYQRGQVLWLENKGDGNFLDHELLYAPGTIHVPVADYDNDGDLDIAAIVSQDEEEVWGFENLGDGNFTPHRVWMTVNYDIGSAGLVETDLDGDGDSDLLLPVGDNLEDSYCIPQPYHGCLWLENEGGWKFSEHRLASFSGTYAAAASDLDSDGDNDVVLCSMVNDWDSPASASATWMENDGEENFQQHTIAKEPIMLTTIACGDLNNDLRPDIVAGGLHLFRPFDRFGRVSSWLNNDDVRSPAPSSQQAPEDKQKPGNPSIVPLPDLSFVDDLTRADLQNAHDRVVAKVEQENDTEADWLKLGQAYYAFGLFSAANGCFELAVVKNPKSILANYLYGVSLARLGKLSDAIEQFHEAISISEKPQHSRLWCEIGRCYLRLEQPTEAESAFVKAGSNSAALAHLAKLRLRSGRAREAVGPLNTLAQQHSGTTEVLLLSYQVSLALGLKEQAQQYRDRAEYNSKKMPSDPIAIMVKQTTEKLGEVKLGKEAKRHVDSENWDEAAPLLERITNSHSGKGAILLLAGTEIQRGNSPRSIKLLEKFIKQSGSDPQATFLLGEAYQSAGQDEAALSIWESLAKISSEPTLHDRLAKQYERLGNHDAAEKQRALSIQAKGIATLRTGNPTSARKYLEQATDLDPSLVNSWFYLAECRRFLGERIAAQDAYNRVLELNPNHGRALRYLMLLSQAS
ncbi:FG-GAP-like repeat-containing protein [Bythopirellula goksoeyrii]|nr:FG-GAP-like repeat-containing protein [Bythopirellula goksoeyrii]